MRHTIVAAYIPRTRMLTTFGNDGQAAAFLARNMEERMNVLWSDGLVRGLHLASNTVYDRPFLAN